MGGPPRFGALKPPLISRGKLQRRMLAMKTMSVIRWSLIAACTLILSACATEKQDDHGQAKKDGWHPTGWINM